VIICLRLDICMRLVLLYGIGGRIRPPKADRSTKPLQIIAPRRGPAAAAGDRVAEVSEVISDIVSGLAPAGGDVARATSPRRRLAAAAMAMAMAMAAAGVRGRNTTIRSG